jgi:hypothetical protein
VGVAWGALEDLPDGSRIAQISNDPSSHFLAYPLFGRRLQHEPVAIFWNGRPRAPLHQSWRSAPPNWWWEFEQMGSAEGGGLFLRNLDELSVDYLLISKWPRRSRHKDQPWPRLRNEVARSMAPGRRIYTDGYSEIWDLRRGSSE